LQGARQGNHLGLSGSGTKALGRFLLMPQYS
jgi:hypothetical protein